MTLDEYFKGYEESRKIFNALQKAVNDMGEAELRVTKSQVAFHRKKAFARVWIPEKYLRGRSTPLILTLGFRQRDDSPRWKEIVEPAPGRFTHHLELYSTKDIDGEVRKWLRAAWMDSG
jgi:hypothetical protein